MLDLKLVRDQPDLVRQVAVTKKSDPDNVDAALRLDMQRREYLTRIETLRSQRNTLTKDDLETGRQIKDELKNLEPQLKEVEAELNLVMRQIPNITLPDVPIGKDESENVVIRKWGTPKQFDFPPKDHLEIGEKLGVINMDMAGKVSGPRLAYLMGDLALMEMALIQLAFKKLTSRGFIPVIPPVFIKPETYIRMARLDPGQEAERYFLPTDNLYLIGSAEHTLGPLHMDQILPESSLPIRYVGFSSAFRREAGSYGKDTRGILRVHQFDKVEMESFTVAEDSAAEQEFLVSLQEEIMQELGLPYQVVMVCTGDMGGPDARQIDIETWMPGQDRYRETHSADLMTDYQSRRLQTRVKRSDGRVELLHMNDATCIAVGRTLIAILENYQHSDGTVTVPEVLRPYLGKDIIKPR